MTRACRDCIHADLPDNSGLGFYVGGTPAIECRICPPEPLRYGGQPLRFKHPGGTCDKWEPVFGPSALAPLLETWRDICQMPDGAPKEGAFRAWQEAVRQVFAPTVREGATDVR